MSRRTAVLVRAVTAAALVLVPLTNADASDAPHLTGRDPGAVRHAAGGNGNGNGNANGATNGQGQGQGNATSNGNDGVATNHGKANGVADAPTSAAPPTTSAPSAPPVDPLAPPAADSPARHPAVSLGTSATAPELGAAVGVTAATGRVVVRTSEGVPTQDLAAAAAIPVGARVDARAGTVELATAIDAAGTTQVGRFTGGIFEVRQSPNGHGLTRLVLVGGAWGDCPAGGAARSAVARAAAKRKPARRLWGSDSGGRFQTEGRGSVATVRGTRWLTEDSCDGTRTTVTQGTVAVRDLRRHRTIVVTAGHSYFAAAPRR